MKKFEVELPDWIVKDLEQHKDFYSVEDMISLIVTVDVVRFMETNLKVRFGKNERDN